MAEMITFNHIFPMLTLINTESERGKEQRIHKVEHSYSATRSNTYTHILIH